MRAPFAPILVGVLCSASSFNAGHRPRAFSYATMGRERDELVSVLHDKGYIVVCGVPGFASAYEQFLGQLSAFAALPDAMKDRCAPPSTGKREERGWERGAEAFNSVRDTLKGSYYFRYPDVPDFNIWPSSSLGVPDLRHSFLGLASIMRSAGEQVLSLLESPLREYNTVARALDYKADDSAGLWCGQHLDRSALTAICAAAYYSASTGKRLDSEPEGAGLFVDGARANIPPDCLGFQVGKVTQLLTNDAVRATPHLVKKVPGVHRRTLALFFEPPLDYVMRSRSVAFPDRFVDGMTYGEFACPRPAAIKA